MHSYLQGFCTAPNIVGNDSFRCAQPSQKSPEVYRNAAAASSPLPDIHSVEAPWAAFCEALLILLHGPLGQRYGTLPQRAEEMLAVSLMRSQHSLRWDDPALREPSP